MLNYRVTELHFLPIFLIALNACRDLCIKRISRVANVHEKLL